jgi:hypothetical protein
LRDHPTPSRMSLRSIVVREKLPNALIWNQKRRRMAGRFCRERRLARGIPCKFDL